MSLVDVDSWIIEYEACDRLSCDIQNLIAQRNRAPKLSDEYGKLSAKTRMRLKQLTNELKQLDNKLRNGNLTADEEERRQRQIESLQSKLIQLQSQFLNAGADGSSSSRSQLFQQSSARLWEDDESDDDEPLVTAGGHHGDSVQDLRKHQQRILENQNDGLDALSKIISRHKDLALQIGNEVDVQNDIIDDLGDDIERTDVRMNSETRHVQMVSRSDSGTWGYWVIIIGLFVAICIVGIL